VLERYAEMQLIFFKKKVRAIQNEKTLFSFLLPSRILSYSKIEQGE